jgi:hypothetical protein
LANAAWHWRLAGKKETLFGDRVASRHRACNKTTDRLSLTKESVEFLD